MTNTAVDWRLVVEARMRLTGVAIHTPLVHARDLTEAGGLYLKAECLQRTHAFKFRGAYNRVSLLSPEQRERGLIAASSGNHALGLSLAGAMLGAHVTVVMPEGAPEVKAQGCRRLGAEVVRHGDVYDDAFAHAQALARDTGRTYVQSFDDPLVAAGQASVAWEIVADLPDVDVLVAPIGGGGLMAGILSLLKTMPEEEARRWFPDRRRPLADITVVGVQAAGAASTATSLQEDHHVELPSIATIADGIAVRKPGNWTFGVLRQWLDDIALVSDDDMLSALGLVAVKEKLICEPAGAAAVSAVLHGKQGARVDLGELVKQGKKIACVISGGNVMPAVLGGAIRMVTP